ncbi:MAG: hypothetical protein U1F50_15915 [Rubrivivax sp.]
MDTAHLLEVAMLTCFGVSWPLGALRMLKSRRAEGRGLLPTALILAGYLAGLGAKVCVACGGGGLAPIFWLYLLNTGSVAANLALQWHYGHRLSASRSAFRTSD